ncbi:MAG: hypothetical protein RLZZ01_2133 [Actinomycetota bacterium]
MVDGSPAARTRQTVHVALPRLRSPLARAVAPVIGGVVVLTLIGLFTWAMAAVIADNSDGATERLAPSTFTIGDVEVLAETVAEDGPLLFPELGTSIGTRSIVVDHTGDVPADGWRVYWAYPADRPASCIVEQIVGTATFEDCEGRILDVSELSPPDFGVFPRVDDRTTLVIDLRGATVSTAPPGSTTPPGGTSAPTLPCTDCPTG